MRCERKLRFAWRNLEEVIGCVVHSRKVLRGHHCLPIQATRRFRHLEFCERFDETVLNRWVGCEHMLTQRAVSVLSDSLHWDHFHSIQTFVYGFDYQLQFVCGRHLPHCHQSCCLQKHNNLSEKNRKTQTENDRVAAENHWKEQSGRRNYDTVNHCINK
jgi:hypothetical protein